MYFSATLSIDPSEITRIEAVKPTKAFGKLLHVLTAGLASKKEEQETFTAVAILQKFNKVFRTMGMNNIVRLSKDEVDFYIDKKGKQDDLKEAMENFARQSDSPKSGLFEALYLVIEHLDKNFKYLLEVDINRRHKVGEFPIDLKINAVMRDMEISPKQTSVDVKKKMETVFKSQDKYDAYLLQKQTAFNQFIDQLEENLQKYIEVDKVIKKTKMNMIRPKKPIQRTNQIPRDHHADPIYYGYYGFGDIFLYAWIWSSMADSNDIYVNNFDVVDEHGSEMMQVGEEGFNAGETNTLNPEADFEPPKTGDIEYYNDHEFQDQFQQANIETVAESVDSTGSDSGGWFDSFGDSFSGGDSSVSSCSSCGGGCGGGCGGS